MTHRDWLTFLPSEGKMICFACWLFPQFSSPHFDPTGSDPNIGCVGFKKGLEKIKSHEMSAVHITSLAKWKSTKTRLLIGKTIDAALQEQFSKELATDRNVLLRIVDVVVFLATQGVAFRGSSHESPECR